MKMLKNPKCLTRDTIKVRFLNYKRIKTVHYQRLKRKENTYFRMELFIKDSGKGIRDMAMDCNSGLTVLNMKASGKTTKPMAKERFIM